MIRQSLLIAIVTLACSAMGRVAVIEAAPPGSENGAIDLELAATYFEEARRLSETDAGKLWGTTLDGPMLFADPQTRRIVSNQVDTEGHLKKEESVFAGTLPDEVNMANTATHWAGVHWTMILWPLPEDKQERLNLMAHELWHRVQDGLGLPTSSPANGHLQERDGRIWLRLEWRALRRALEANAAERREAIRDALVFREYRRSLFDGAADEERALELNEGLAEYTGIVLSRRRPADRRAAAVLGIVSRAQQESFMRSFAYASGPAYGILLDEAGANWRQGLVREGDLGNLLAKAASIDLSVDLRPEAQRRMSRYGGTKITAEERSREQERRAVIDRLRATLVEGPTLTLPFRQMSISFDPNGMESLENEGNVYDRARITDVWGVLTATGSVLVDPQSSKAVVSAPTRRDGNLIIGDGWKLELSTGWYLRPDKKAKSFTLHQREE